MFEVKPYIPEYYPELCVWWEQWGWSPIPQEYLPSDGLIVSSEGKNICAAFIYKTNTPICWAENYISCKDAGKIERQRVLDLLVGKVVETAVSFGFQVVMSSIGHPVLGRRLEKNGFVVSDTNMTTYMRKV